MENCEETNIMPVVDVDEVNCNVLNPSSCKDIVSMLPESIEEVFTGIEDGNFGSSNTSNCEDIVGGIALVSIPTFWDDEGPGAVIRYEDTDTVPKFEFYWRSSMDKFGWHNDCWLDKLYNLREKWCLTFNKDFFSGRVLSSQRSETTNHVISRRLLKLTTLCDDYQIFDDVVSEWRNNANMEDFRCKQEYCQGLLASNDGEHVTSFGVLIIKRMKVDLPVLKIQLESVQRKCLRRIAKWLTLIFNYNALFMDVEVHW
ncbi:hypothetical protein M9H77_12924 [Catharanthus roseus]|uniref:Uncharacterized protein n=1 Tax=Catharanthus roseus TaxID=4058 RepID=A0ACC0BIP1_CATRO|nr:hypothetical protein M9H77_12924 [Catharanthus roseus]